jgi:hypothetical protein
MKLGTGLVLLEIIIKSQLSNFLLFILRTLQVDRGSKAGVGEIFTAPSRPAPRPSQPPVQWVADLFSGGKAAGAWR